MKKEHNGVTAQTLSVISSTQHMLATVYSLCQSLDQFVAFHHGKRFESFAAPQSVLARVLNSPLSHTDTTYFRTMSFRL